MYIKAHDKIAIVRRDAGISYKELLRYIHYYATLFDAQTTDKIAIYSANRPEWLYAFYSAWKNDGIAVPIDFMAPAEEVAYILNDCRPEVIFCSEENTAVLNQALKSVNYEMKLFIFEELNYDVNAFAPDEI